MAKFLFSYRAQQDYTIGRPDTAAAWRAWFDSMGTTLVDRGLPVVESIPLGNLGADTRLGGYSIVTADDLDAAIAIAKGCPALSQGGGVEVGPLIDLEAASRGE
jgi:YCII-related domain